MNIGVSMMGGGARGTAYLGFLKALAEKGVKATHMIGSSTGAVIAASKGLGYDDATIISYYKALHDYDLTNTLRMQELSFKFFGEKTFAEAKTDFLIQVTNLITKSSEVISSGLVAMWVLASSQICIDAPIVIDHVPYVDGDLSAGYGASALRARGVDFVLGLNLGESSTSEIEGVSSEQMAILALSARNALRHDQKVDPVDLLISDICPNVHSFDFSRVEEYYEIGYEKGRAVDLKDVV